MLRLLSRRRAAPIRIAITLPLIAANVLAIHQVLAATIRTPRPHIIVDLSAVDVCDYTGAVLLQTFITVVRDHGGRVELQGARPPVTSALHHAAAPTSQP